MVETTLDLDQAQRGEFIVKADFDDKLGGIEFAYDRARWLKGNDFEFVLLELKSELDECASRAEKILSRVGSDLKLETSKSVKLESNGQIGYFFRVTLKDEKNLRNNRNYQTIDTNKSGVRFRNSALEGVNETYLKVRRDYEQQQSSVVKEILSVACA